MHQLVLPLIKVPVDYSLDIVNEKGNGPAMDRSDVIPLPNTPEAFVLKKNDVIAITYKGEIDLPTLKEVMNAHSYF